MSEAMDRVKVGQKAAMDAFAKHIDQCTRCAAGPFSMCQVGEKLCGEWSTADVLVKVVERMERS